MNDMRKLMEAVNEGFRDTGGMSSRDVQRMGWADDDEPEDSRSTRGSGPQGPWNIYIDDKVVKGRDGDPMRFDYGPAAMKAAGTLRQKPWNRDKKIEIRRIK